MFFSIVYVIDATCFDKCFLFHVIAGRRLPLLRDFFNRHIVVFFQASILKDVRILRISTITVQY